MAEEATDFGFSAAGAEELVARSAAARDVVDVKHVSFKEKPEAERLPNMSSEALYQAIKEMETPRSGVTSAERRAVFTLLYRQIKEDNDRARRFTKKLEGHRKLKRYDKRAANQFRKSARIKIKKTNPKKCLVSLVILSHDKMVHRSRGPWIQRSS